MHLLNCDGIVSGRIIPVCSMLLSVMRCLDTSHGFSQILFLSSNPLPSSHNVCRRLDRLSYKKGKFLYSTVSSPQDRSKRFTLYFPDRPVHSDTNSASLGSIQPYASINVQRLLIHMSTTVYSQVLIYTAE